MKKANFTDEQIVAVLRDAEATTTVAAACKHGVFWTKQNAGSLTIPGEQGMSTFKMPILMLTKPL